MHLCALLRPTTNVSSKKNYDCRCGGGGDAETRRIQRSDVHPGSRQKVGFFCRKRVYRDRNAPHFPFNIEFWEDQSLSLNWCLLSEWFKFKAKLFSIDGDLLRNQFFQSDGRDCRGCYCFQWLLMGGCVCLNWFRFMCERLLGKSWKKWGFFLKNDQCCIRSWKYVVSRQLFLNVFVGIDEARLFYHSWKLFYEARVYVWESWTVVC